MSNTKYYCESCREVTDEYGIVPGRIISEDKYINPTCPECGSENLAEISDKDICPVCGGCHEENDDWKYCVREWYGGDYAVDFLIESERLEDFARHISEQYGGFEKCFYGYIENENLCKEYIEFVSECDKKHKTEVA